MRCTSATLIWYRKYVDALVGYLSDLGVTTLASIQPDHLRSYLVDLQRRDLAARTVHHHASAARAFFNFCTGEDLITLFPMRRGKMPRMPKEILPAFSPEEVRSILGACHTTRDTAIVLCLLDSGCRATEFMALNVGDVDTKTRPSPSGRARVFRFDSAVFSVSSFKGTFTNW
jgi:site-specific recombinase XerD